MLAALLGSTLYLLTKGELMDPTVRLWIGSELDLAEFVEVMLRFGADQAVLDRCIVRVGAAHAE